MRTPGPFAHLAVAYCLGLLSCPVENVEQNRQEKRHRDNCPNQQALIIKRTCVSGEELVKRNRPHEGQHKKSDCKTYDKSGQLNHPLTID